MMTKKGRIVAGALCAFVCSVGTSHATLIDRGGGLIYDDVLNVTWMQDANYSRTTGFSESMSWSQAMAFASNLEFEDAVRQVTWTDWRLPSTINAPSSAGWDTTGLSSELAFMYYVNLGYEANYSFDRYAPAPESNNYNPFVNLAYRGFWSETISDNPDRAWGIHFHFGAQVLNGVNDGLRVWLVRDGDVAASVPEPGTFALFGLALAGMGLTRRRRKA